MGGALGHSALPERLIGACFNSPRLNTAASQPNSQADRIRKPTPRARRLAPPRIPLLSHRPKQSACSTRTLCYICLIRSHSCGFRRPSLLAGLADFCFLPAMVFMISESPYGGLLHRTYRW